MDELFIHIILVPFQTRVVDIMGQLLEGDNDPDLSEKELKDIGLLLMRHAMANSQMSLAAAILSRYLFRSKWISFVSDKLTRFPDILSGDFAQFQNKDSLTLLFYTGMVSALLFFCESVNQQFRTLNFCGDCDGCLL